MIEPASVKCRNCGRQNAAGDRQCEECGRALRQGRSLGYYLLFTLGVAGLALFSLLLLSSFARMPHRAQGQLSSCESNEKNIGTGLEMYATDNKGLYPKTMLLVTPNYLKVLPTCPSAGNETYSGTFSSASNPDAYTFWCQGGNHSTLLNGSANFPQYNSAQGLVSGH